MKVSPIERRIINIVEPVLTDMGFALVRLKIMGGTQNPTLQIMAEPLEEGKNINVDECAEISRELSAILDVDEPIDGRYTLEISSPGLDRPLTRPKDFARYTGMEARVEIDPPFEGQKKFRGRIVDVDENEEGFTLETEEGEQFDIGFVAVLRAKLILTDELLAQAQKQS